MKYVFFCVSPWFVEFSFAQQSYSLDIVTCFSTEENLWWEDFFYKWCSKKMNWIMRKYQWKVFINEE